ncbi:MAG TPA: AI-2E family transporter [Pyrinomonadaceae bacterium]|nr:AI-2E family transporter [Pyrinomonadaceae bacterium]
MKAVPKVVSVTPAAPEPPATTASLPLMDVLIRITLLGALAILCYRIFSPFLTLTVWSIILAVTLYPLHQRFARRIGGKQGLASTILIVVGLLLIITPVALLLNSFADSTRYFISAVQQDKLDIPPPRAGIEHWPLVGRRLHDGWSKAHSDLPGFVRSMQPKIGQLAQRALGMVASIGTSLLLFLVSFVVAGILMAYGGSGEGFGRGLFVRVAGATRGESLFKLTTATIRAVASGVIGVAFIQATLVGLALLLAGVPAAGVLAVIALVLAIAQLPALLITLPAIIYIWTSGHYGTGMAITHTVILLLVGIADNILKPLMLGRGVDVPMPVILLGALGGMASGGILGMFVGATLFAIGHQVFMMWLNEKSNLDPVVSQAEAIELGQAAAKT